jgi:hypothetical protein
VSGAGEIGNLAAGHLAGNGYFFESFDGDSRQSSQTTDYGLVRTKKPSKSCDDEGCEVIYARIGTLKL